MRVPRLWPLLIRNSPPKLLTRSRMWKRPVITREAESKRTLAKKQARILTDTPIRRSPDCATIGGTACFGHGPRFFDQIIR